MRYYLFDGRLARVGLIAALALAACATAQAQWKWRDGRGQMQYSDLPPPGGTPERDILQRPAASPRTAQTAAEPASAGSAASAPALPTVDPALEARRKQLEQQEAAKRKADEVLVAQQRAQNCERIRAQLRNLESGQRMARTNAKGEREFVDDATRAQETAQARQMLGSECR